jgi:hypothetical protein
VTATKLYLHRPRTTCGIVRKAIVLMAAAGPLALATPGIAAPLTRAVTAAPMGVLGEARTSCGSVKSWRPNAVKCGVWRKLLNDRRDARAGAITATNAGDPPKL